MNGENHKAYQSTKRLPTISLSSSYSQPTLESASSIVPSASSSLTLPIPLPRYLLFSIPRFSDHPLSPHNQFFSSPPSPQSPFSSDPTPSVAESMRLVEEGRSNWRSKGGAFRRERGVGGSVRRRGGSRENRELLNEVSSIGEGCGDVGRSGGA